MIAHVQKMLQAQAVREEELAAYLDESKGLERNYFRELLRSRQNAWIVAAAGVCFGAASLLALLIHISLASKPVAPFILRVDNATGQTDVVSVMKTQQASYSEVIDQYWVSQYVIHRESYDWNTIQYDYNMTGLLSTSAVSSQYAEMFNGDKARDKTLADKGRIVVTMESPPVIDATTGTATARFATTLKWRGGEPDEIKHWISTLSYKYSSSAMRAQDRLTNPLGFQVTSYRLNPELGH